MTEVKISAEIIEQMVFGYTKHPVRITGAIYDSRDGTITFDIEGEDVPGVVACEAVCTEHRNRAGQRLIEMQFEALPE